MHRKLFYGLNFALVLAFAWSICVDYSAGWRKYQKEYWLRQAQYFEKQAGEATDPAEKDKLLKQAKAARHEPLVVRQIIARDLGRVDRCVSCHVGMDEFANPSMTTPFAEHPYTAHPDMAVIGKKHSFQKYGCTVCHQGQGLATEKADAHGKVHHWEKPMLEGKLMQASCAKCHQNFHEVKGAETVAMGDALFHKHGCVGCHAIRGQGGVVSVDLGNIADKPLERIARYNLSLIKKDGKPLPEDDWNLQEWIYAHLSQRPSDFIPNDPFAKFNKEPIAPSGMPDFSEELPEGGAQAITAYLMSMSDENIPMRYAVAQAPKPEPKFASAVEHGKFVFNKFGCAGCHGLEAKAGRANFNATGDGQDAEKGLETDMDKGREPTLRKTAGTYSRDELRNKIQNGVSSAAITKFNQNGPTPPLYMPAWKDKVKGQELEDLISYLQSIAEKGEPW